ncbi:peptidylprolyl isomerase [Candidatus Pelagibacter sp.]|nr:peptidylprolyl isomerase [Candidatus Pelagibacter sp.]
MILKKLSIFFIILFYPLNAYALENKILVKVNNTIITSVDIFKETQYLLAINKDIKKLSKNKIFDIAKNSLIRKTIKQNEIAKYNNIKNLDEKFTNQLIKTNAIKLGFNSIDDFQKHLMSYGVDLKDLKDRLSTTVLWNDLIVKKYSNKLRIDKEKIREEILLSDKKLKSYLLSEIVVDLPFGAKIEEQYKIIDNEILKKGFDNAALLYSISDTSSSGGNLGWIKETALNKSIKNKISNLEIGQHTKPIIISGGFLVLKIKDIKELNQQLNIKKELQKRIIENQNQQLNQFSLMYYNRIKKDVKINEL